MADELEQQKFDIYLSPETEFILDGLVRAGKFGSTAEALLIAVELGVQQLADEDDITDDASDS